MSTRPHPAVRWFHGGGGLGFGPQALLCKCHNETRTDGTTEQQAINLTQKLVLQKCRKEQSLTVLYCFIIVIVIIIIIVIINFIF